MPKNCSASVGYLLIFQSMQLLTGSTFPSSRIFSTLWKEKLCISHLNTFLFVYYKHLPQLTQDRQYAYEIFSSNVKRKSNRFINWLFFYFKGVLYNMYLLHKVMSFHFTNIWSCKKFSLLLVLLKMLQKAKENNCLRRTSA